MGIRGDEVPKSIVLDDTPPILSLPMCGTPVVSIVGTNSFILQQSIIWSYEDVTAILTPAR
jgi:hypothetical protein